MGRRTLVPALCAGVIFGLGTPLYGGQQTRPNIVVILADDLGWGDVGCFGAPDLETPHIDRLATEGMRMVNFYANCPVCSPTRASLLTGCFPDEVGVPGVIRTHSDNSWGFLDPRKELLPAFLSRGGYHTALVGKWHLGLAEPNTPTLRGFTFFHGFLGDMMDDYYNHRRHGINYMRLNETEIDPAGHATELFTTWACEYLQQQAEAARAGRPFFLYLAYNAPHTPIQPPEEWLTRYRQKHPEAPEKRAKLAALIEHLDWGVGQVLQTLDKTGLADNTLVIFTSDNGGQIDVGANNGPYRAGKGTMYEGGIRVPMVVRWPGRIKPGSRSEVVALTMDLFSTILDAAAVPIPADRSGVTLLPIWRGEKTSLPARDLFWVRLEGGVFSYAARRGNYKLVRPHARKGSQPPDELYDLAKDPYEQHDLKTEKPELFEEMTRLLEEHIRRVRHIPWRDEHGRGPGEITR